MKDKNVVFMGTPDFAVPVLKMLIDETNVVMVVTQPDREVGRKKEVVFSPIKKVAVENNIPVFQPVRIRKDNDVLKELDIDLIVTCAYGQIIPKEVLDLPKMGCVNVHASILPKYRGSAPIQWAIFNGEEKTGVTIMYMDEGMDTGDIIVSKEIPITDSDNVGTMHDKLSVLGECTLKEVLPKILDGTCGRTKQGDDFTLAPMIKRDDERLNFNSNGSNIINKIRGMNPWPLANILVDGKEIKVIDAEFKEKSVDVIGKIEVSRNSFGITCNDGIIYLKRVKQAGKKEMDISNFINGIKVGEYQGKLVD